ncbi:MAG: hypothetical protein II171_04610 [Bacteroidales bacterium]|nr:hypothetical protein [Bacteroidales bacterium]
MELCKTYCLECGEPMGYGRPDRKFCCVSCKNRWHNKQRALDWHAEQDRIHRILTRNHAILARLLRMGVVTIDRLTLYQMGYNDHYVTYFSKEGTHHRYACYDIQYETTPSRIIHLGSRVDYTRRGKGRGSEA